MRLLLVLLMFVPLSGNAAATLKGTWKSDYEQTMQFVKAHSVLEDRQSDFLEGLIGHLRLSFDGRKMQYRIPDLSISIQNKPQHFVGADDSYQYQVLGADQDSVAIKLNSFYGRDRIWHIHFVSDDVFWLYSEESDYGLRDLNFREYFRRIE